MNPVDFPEANLRLTAPPSMPDCLPLAVHRYPARVRREPFDFRQVYEDLTTAQPCTCTTEPHGEHCAKRLQEERLNRPGETTREPGGFISRWEPTPEERAAIAAGGPVWVYVVGEGAPPPIAVSGVSPFLPPPAEDASAIYQPGVAAAGGRTAPRSFDEFLAEVSREETASRRRAAEAEWGAELGKRRP